MEKLGENYLKPDEKEVLLLMGNKLVAHCSGYDNRYLGKDGQPALMYDIEVYPPEFKEAGENQEEIEKSVFNSENIAEIRKFFEDLNNNVGGEFPSVPDCYEEWKSNFKKLVFLEISKLA